MAFAGDLNRLKRLTREVLLREVLREFQGESQRVFSAVENWRRWRAMTDADMLHYASQRDECSCAVCTQIRNHSTAEIPARFEGASGDAWVDEALALIEKRAPGCSPRQLKGALLLDRYFESRSEEELLHYALHGFFLVNTPEQQQLEQECRALYEAS
jgi:hypothetical protein